MELKDYISYATRVAYSLWKDPEAESIANEAAWRAYTSYRDPAEHTGNYTEEGWIALLTKQAVWGEWRKQAALKRNNEPTDGWWEDVIATTDEPVSEDAASREDWQLLCEYYVDRWPLDVVAREHKTSQTHIKRKLAAALQRFLDGVQSISPELLPG